MLTEEFERRAAALSERAEQELPPSWRPDQGGDDRLLGEVVGERIVHGKGYSGGPCTVVVIRERDGRDHAVWLWHQVLRDEWEAQKPPLGALVLIRYLGKAEARDGRAGAHRYRLEVDGGTRLDSPSGEPSDGPDRESVGWRDTFRPRSLCPGCEHCGRAGSHSPGCPDENF